MIPDITGNGWNATLYNNAFASKGVLTLDGTGQYAEFPKEILSNFSEFTITCWVNVPVFSPMARIWDFGEDEGNYIALIASNDFTGIPVFEARFDYEEVQRIELSQAIPQNKWVHLAVSLNEFNISIYLDSLLVASQYITFTPSNFSNATQNWLGKSQNPNDTYFNGSIADFHIHDRPLLVEQILAESQGIFW